MNHISVITKEIEESYNLYEHGESSKALDIINKCIDNAVREEDKESIALNLALKSLYSYNYIPFLNVMRELENAYFLANSLNNSQLTDIINFIFAKILYNENDKESAKRYFSLIKYRDNVPFDTNQLENNLYNGNSNTPDERNPMLALLNIAKTVSSNTDINSLLKTIADETTYALNAERCTVFILDKKTNELWSKVATGLDVEEIRFPMNKGLAGHVAMTGETVNIKDAYSDSRFNKEIDIQTGYHTNNILCMPIRNMHYEIIGVLQVLNKRQTCFFVNDEKLLVTISMNAGIAIENSRLFKKQQEMLVQQKKLFDSFIDTLVASIDARDKITSGHSTRVKLYAKLICDEMQIDKQYTSLVEQAAILHDIGKIGIRDSVLQKEGKLTPEEYAHIQEHARITHDILSKIYNTDDTELISEIASTHHEKFNGTGYYQGLAGSQIPFGGRILAVADVFDAITSKRHYRDRMSFKKVISIIIEDSGTHFDPDITKYFLNITCDKIIDVFLYENGKHIDKTDKDVLSKLTLRDFYNILNKNYDELFAHENEAIERFQKYYII